MTQGISVKQFSVSTFTSWMGVHTWTPNVPWGVSQVLVLSLNPDPSQVVEHTVHSDHVVQ